MFEDIGSNCEIRVFKFRKKHVKAIKSLCRFFFHGGLLIIHAKEFLLYMVRIKLYGGNRHQLNYLALEDRGLVQMAEREKSF